MGVDGVMIIYTPAERQTEVEDEDKDADADADADEDGRKSN